MMRLSTTQSSRRLLSSYAAEVAKAEKELKNHKAWHQISAESVARMRLQNRFQTGLDIAKHTAKVMRQDMADYDANPANYTQSLGCWHGFVAQQMAMSLKKRHSLKGKMVYLSGWMVAALRSEFGPLPDQSMHEKTSVPSLVEEIYTFLRQADARELHHLFKQLDEAESDAARDQIIAKIDAFETHCIPIIADVDAGFGNEEATYLLGKKMIEAGACALQLENQVSDAKQCGHQAGKVTVPHEDFLAKINALRYAFLELGVEDGIIIARTDSLGADLTQKIPVSHKPGDLGSKYCEFLDTRPAADGVRDYEMAIKMNGEMRVPKRLPSGLFSFRPGTGEDRVVLDCVTAMKNGADLLWIETEKPHVGQIASMVDRIRQEVPHAKLVYNNSPSFNWTLKKREEVYEMWKAEGQDLSKYPDPSKDPKVLMDVSVDGSPLADAADKLIQQFQREASLKAGVFHHLITLPTYHDTALGTDVLSEGYFGEEGMLAYVKGVQRREIRRELAAVKHQDLAGSAVGDEHKAYFSKENALQAGGEANTMNQF